jgi:hypothetical protein
MNLVQRAKSLLLTPKTEFQVIDNERTSGMPLVMSYLLPLAVLAALATFVGYVLISRGGFKFGLYFALIGLVQLVVSVYVTALIADMLAPSFDAQKNLDKSLQLLIYSSTPVFVGSLLNVIPQIGWLGLLAGGIYSLYLLYIGIPILKKSSEDKTPLYLIVIILSAAILFWLVQYIIGRVAFPSMYGYRPYGL